MARYFFDIDDGYTQRDETGMECEDLQDAVREAKRLLPSIALDEVPRNGERHAVTVLVTDEDGKPVYSAAQSYLGIWLLR